MRAAPISTCAFTFVATALAACGGGEGAIVMHTLDLTPGCWTDRPPEPPLDASDAYRQMVQAARSIAEFNLAFDVQRAKLLGQPVLEDPTATSWRKDLVNGGYVEGEVLGSGEGWSVLKMVAVFPPRSGDLGWMTARHGPEGIDATIDVTPMRTVFDFGSKSLEARDGLLISGDHVRGCDARRGVSFEIRPSFDLERLGSERHCWPWPSPEGTGNPEFEASFQLQCLQLIERSLQGL